MALTDTKVRSLKAQDAPYKVSDGGGLHLLVQPSGSKLWRMAYRFRGRQKTAAFGIYPAISLGVAREKREDAKKLLRLDQDPGAAVKAAKVVALTTFGAVSAEWKQRRVVAAGRSASTLARTRWLLDILDSGLGDKLLGEIEAPDILEILRRVEANGRHEAVVRLRATASAIFRFGIAAGYCKRDPAADLKGALTSVASIPHAAVTHPSDIGELMRALPNVRRPKVRLALNLLALTAVRPGEVCRAEWSEIDGDVWDIPTERMKMRLPHRVPLSRQAVAVIEELRKITGNRKHLFASSSKPDRPFTTNRLNCALDGIGFPHERHVAHGFRSTFSTIANESGKWPPDVIELCLAHADRNKVRSAYNRALRWSERVELMAWWADQLDSFREAKPGR